MSKEESLKFKGTVTELLPGQMYRVKLENNHIILAYASGKIKQNKIKILIMDQVEVEMTPYDLTKGRITYRYR